MEPENRKLGIMATIPTSGEPGVGQYKWRPVTVPRFSPLRQGPCVYPVGTKSAILPCCPMCPDTQGGDRMCPELGLGSHREF